MFVLAVVAGGAWFATRPDDGASASEASSKDEPATAESELHGLLATTAPTTPLDASTSAAASSGPLTWSPIDDPASGLRWSMPGTDITPVPDMLGLAIGGPRGGSTSWTSAPGEMSVDVTVWSAADPATQADIDEVMTFDHDLHRRINEPYGKDLTLAGQPALAVLSTPKPDNTYVAMAIVDGALVRVQVSALGKPIDPAVFEKVVASFAKG